MARKKSRRKTKGPRKNPKRVAAGKKAAAKRFGKKARKKASKRVSGSKLEKAIEKVLSRRYAVSIDGSVHKVAFPGHRQVKRGKSRSGYKHSAENLANLARGRAIRQAKLAARKGTMFGPVYNPHEAGKGGLRQMRLAALAKARARKAEMAAARKSMTGEGFLGSFI